MSYAEATANVAGAYRNHAPFLVWPVARREFYTAIASALVLPLGWGIVIFGWRALILILASLCGSLLGYLLLHRVGQRGKHLLLAHIIASALILAALCQGLWLPLYVSLAALAMVGLIWLFGGTGYERVHACLLTALTLTLLLSAGEWHAKDEGAILARNRLFMGDLHQTAPLRFYHWPRSNELGGQDAALLARPNVVVSDTLHHLAAEVIPGADLAETRKHVQAIIDEAIVKKLPEMENVLLGVIPGPIGVVSGLGIAISGLYLAYRNILRPRSWLLFWGTTVLGLIAGAFILRLNSVEHLGWANFWQLLTPGEAVTFLFYELLSTDILFAAVFILALPGSEPVTGWGRRVYLVTAGIFAGFLHWTDMPIPASTLVLVAMQPLAGAFDRLLAHRSWLRR